MRIEKLIGQKVNILPFKLEGRIIEISFKVYGVMAGVRYLYNMEIQEGYFYIDKLEIANQEKAKELAKEWVYIKGGAKWHGTG